MKINLTLFLFLTITLFSQSRIYPPLSGDEITDISFINDEQGIFINSGGEIYKTYDKGISWNKIKTYQGERFQKIKFLDENIGFILPESYYATEINGFVVTSDGGENWRIENLSVWRSVDFLPIDERVLLQSDSDGNILRLNNFFDQWDTTYSLPKYVIHDDLYGDIYYPYGTVNQFELLPSGDILALSVYWEAASRDIIDDSLNVLLRSNDEGVTWDTLWIGFNSLVDKIDFINNNIGYLLNGNDTIYYTSNGGVNWNKKSSPSSMRFINDFAAVGLDSIFAVGDEKLSLSIDKGSNWSDSNLELNMYDKIYFQNNEVGLVYGNNLLRTSNAGQNWLDLNNHFIDGITELDFVNTEIGFAVGHNGFYKSTNGGKEWSNLSSSIPSSIAMISETHGFISRFSEALLSTIDGGLTWNSVELENNPDAGIKDVYFFNENFGMVHAAQKKISNNPLMYQAYDYITTDAGNTWNISNSDSSSKANYFDKIVFVEPNSLYGLNSISGLFVSHDSAKTWEKICDLNNFVGNASFDFFDEKFGVIAVSYWNNLITTDGGINWNLFQKDIGIHPADFEILGKDNSGRFIAFECGRDGKIVQYTFSDDGEVLFQRQIITGTNEQLNQIEKFYNGDNLHTWTAGYKFNIFYKDHQLEITSVDEKQTSIISDYTLSQNYPNPFNPITTIKYSIPAETGHAPSLQTNVTLKVYDILGNEVSTLVNEQKSAGNYEVKFNAVNLASGIYFYKIQAGSFNKVRKMMLLK